MLQTPDPALKTDINQWRKSKDPYLLIFLKDETPESLSWGAVGSGLPNGKNKGTLYPDGSRLSAAGAGLTGAEGMIRAEGPRSVGAASSRNSNKSSPPETGVKVTDNSARAIRTQHRVPTHAEERDCNVQAISSWIDNVERSPQGVRISWVSACNNNRLVALGPSQASRGRRNRSHACYSSYIPAELRPLHERALAEKGSQCRTNICPGLYRATPQRVGYILYVGLCLRTLVVRTYLCFARHLTCQFVWHYITLARGTQSLALID